MSQPTKRNDGKLLFAIAGGIIVIAAGIAILVVLAGFLNPKRSHRN